MKLSILFIAFIPTNLRTGSRPKFLAIKNATWHEIKSAKNLTQDEINKITQELSNNFKSEIKLNYTHDQSLIGGLVVQIGSTMIDTSIKKKLQQLENRMIEA